MTHPLRVCAVTGGRADYGLLTPVIMALRQDPHFALRLVVTGQHLQDRAAGVVSSVFSDGFEIGAEIDMHLGDDDAASIIRSSARLIDGIADALQRIRPDIVLLLGDRYETACVAVAATIARIPLAHIAGGDITEGAFDDAFRHAVSKMSHLHFVTNESSARRLRQLGEPPDRIHVVGSPGLDRIRSATIPGRERFFASVGLAEKSLNLVVTFHPVTLAEDSLAQLEELLAALDQLGEDIAVLFTGSNADPEGRRIDERINEFVSTRSSMRFVRSLGSERYFAALSHMDAVVGNSSSGLYEAPTFGIPTVNVGDRQTGRLKAESVIDCVAQRGAIVACIRSARTRGRKPTVNPYGDGHASERIVAELARLQDPRALLHKRFVDLETV